MSAGRSLAPWIVDDPVEISPTQFEELVCSWLAGGAQDLADFRIERLRKVSGAGGEYAIDIALEFTILGGARILVLVECKHQRRPIERDQVMILEAKLRDTGAHKGMLFSTSGFQRGALEYAKTYRIATVTVQDGRSIYETKGLGPTPAIPPPWLEVGIFVGLMLQPVEEGIRFERIDSGHLDAVKKWFGEPVHPPSDPT